MWRCCPCAQDYPLNPHKDQEDLLDCLHNVVVLEVLRLTGIQLARSAAVQDLTHVTERSRYRRWGWCWG